MLGLEDYFLSFPFEMVPFSKNWSFFGGNLLSVYYRAKLIISSPNKIFRIQILTLEVISCEFPPKTSKHLGGWLVGWCSKPHEFLLISSSFRIFWFQMLIQKKLLLLLMNVYSSSCLRSTKKPGLTQQNCWNWDTSLTHHPTSRRHGGDPKPLWHRRPTSQVRRHGGLRRWRGTGGFTYTFWLKNISSWWLNQPIWKICLSNWKSSPKYWWKKEIFETTT